jgi:hypothetical protein
MAISGWRDGVGGRCGQSGHRGRIGPHGKVDTFVQSVHEFQLLSIVS